MPAVDLGTVTLSSTVFTAATVIFVVAGCCAAAMAVYLMILAVAAVVSGERRGGWVVPTSRLIVLIPAHDEAAVIARCVRSLREQSYPSHLYRIVVIADNCTDETARIAASAGAAAVMERNEPTKRGKGRALRWAMDRLLSADASTDAIVVVDADSIANGEFLTALVQPFEAGARAVQGESLLYGADTTKTRLRVIAFLLINRVRPTGRSVLGLSATHLAGNGMLLDSRLLAAKPWDAFTSAEDVEYGLNLRASGVKIAFARGAVVWSPTAPTDEAADRQQLRWEGGKAHLARAYVPRLVAQSIRERKPSLLSVAFELAMPPLGFLAAIVLAGGLGSAWLAVAGELSAVVVSPWLLAIISLVLFVFIGMKAAGVSREGYRALLSVPIFILGKLLRARRILSFRGDTWVRTDRAAGTELRRES